MVLAVLKNTGQVYFSICYTEFFSGIFFNFILGSWA